MPSFNTFNDDGTAAVKLTRPARIGGTQTDTLVLRCPSVADVMAFEADRKGGTNLEQEVRHIAALVVTGAAPEEIKALPWPDYRRLQETFSGFFGVSAAAAPSGAGRLSISPEASISP